MTRFRFAAAAFATSVVLASPAAFAQSGTVKIAWIDPLSGMMAPLGRNMVRSWQYAADLATREKWAGDVKFEVVPFDNKLSPQESLTALKSIVDQGIRYIVQGNGSGVAIALSDAVAKHNERNPGKEIVYLNYAAIDPSLTNARCNFWHFALDINSDMKMEALTSYMAKRPEIRKVYLINQDYAFGHSVERAAEEYLKRKRPDVEVVGKDRHPLAQVRDFTPYVAKIKAAGADTIITGNWGADLALLIKAAKDAGLNANFYTYYAGATGAPTAMGAAGADHVRQVSYWHPNDSVVNAQPIVEGFRKKFNDDYYTMATYTGFRLLSEAMKKAKSTDPVKVAFAMEGLKVQSLNGEVEMRATDHQAQQAVYISSWQKVDGKTVRFDQENTGYGWRTEAKLDSYVASQPTSCQMKRPAAR
ncbi:MAG: branched-chain amino acid ABC transporter substrate-binding protein [Lautropia sp.]|nr:branched-chain amino acid ABC transporter substrate-binding protein [Lautropia sp.]MCL4700320.1 branched-chain amino acid ABC transporter substrate-binding protein [Burkholderiaceae bacterium]MDL1906867.1 branched-chain amino acid ABC transporter substrate-binding protein [Betaproteobacteria bacterium PRO1]RIK90759.1 MAG: branched-chain amino acid ABC transporter substrate-binding protein [Burkholderiales bacterium]